MALLSQGLLSGSLLSRGLLPQTLLRASSSRGVTWVVLDHGQSNTDLASFATNSMTPEANKVVYAGVTARHSSSAGSPEPTLTGCNLTWVKVNTHVQATNQRLHVFRALGASPTAGALTFDYAGEVQTGYCWSIVQATGADTSGTNGSGATVQSVVTGGTSVTSVTTTLAALGSATNAALVFVALSSQGTVVRDPLFTELSADNTTPNTCTLEVQWATNQVACTPTFTSATASAMAIEVKAA